MSVFTTSELLAIDLRSRAWRYRHDAEQQLRGDSPQAARPSSWALDGRSQHHPSFLSANCP